MGNGAWSTPATSPAATRRPTWRDRRSRDPTGLKERSASTRAFLPPGRQSVHVNDDPDAGNEREPWEAEEAVAAVPVDPGSPSAENVAFVLLGSLLTLFVLARVA